MKSVPNKIIPLLVAVLGLIVGYVLAHPQLFDLCHKTYTTSRYVGCLDKSIELLGYPFVNFFVVMVPIALIALLLDKTIFRSWATFAAWWTPLSLLCAFYAPTTQNQTFEMIRITNDGTAKFFALIFLIISVAIWAFGYLKSKKKK